MATPDHGQKLIFWPDLSRFGASLSVVYNPSVGVNLLRFSITDRERFAMSCGHPDSASVFRVLEGAGFALASNEAEVRFRTARRALQGMVLSPGEMFRRSEEVENLRNGLHFYSRSIAVSRDRVRRLVPAAVRDDFRDMPLSEVKHLDFAHVGPAEFDRLSAGSQDYAPSDPVVYYTTPADRAWLHRLQDDQVVVQEVLGLMDSADGAVPADQAGPDIEELARWRVPGLAKNYMARQAVAQDGHPLRAIGAGAVVSGYLSFDAAVAANGGDPEGIEEVRLAHAWPIAFRHPERKVLLVKDARYLEFPRASFIGPDEELKDTVGAHWAFLDKLQLVRDGYADLVEQDLLSQGRWDDDEVLDAAAAAVRRVGAALDECAVAANQRPGRGIGVHDITWMGGFRRNEAPGAVTQAVGQDFIEFLQGFQALQETIGRRVAERDADKLALQGVNDALSRVATAGEVSSRREDAGVKIGGARKDYAARWLHFEEVSGLSPRERLQVVVKENVWPAPDWAAMAEQGVAPEIAYYMRDLRNALPVSPARGGYNIKRRNLQMREAEEQSAERCENYVKAVSIVRDALTGVKTREDLLRAILAIREAGDMDIYAERANGRGEDHVSGHGWDSRVWFDDAAGYAFCNRFMPDIVKGVSEGALSSWQLDRALVAAKMKVEGGWGWAAPKRRVKVEEEGEKQAKPEPEIAHLAEVVRRGPDYRQGRDVDEQMLLDVFGFRGVEYGNWLPQAERQVVLNHAFDSFMDLSRVLRLPPRAMSLGGELAVAFGARGTGGKGAARAHYEPGRNVINLTRLSGAGALAHEWGHAYDYWLAQACNVSTSRALTDSSSKTGIRHSPSGMDGVLASAFVRVANETLRRFKSREEVIREALEVDVDGEKATTAQASADGLKRFVANLDRLLPEDKRDGVFREFAEAEYRKRLVAMPGDDPQYVVFQDSETFLRDIGTALDLQLGSSTWRQRVSLDYPRRVTKFLADRVSRAKRVEANYRPEDHEADSVFLADAEYYDSFRSKPYWSKRVELFARAFESWVQDRVESEPGSLSQYLVHGVQARPQAEHSGYPRGEERTRINEALDRFFESFRPHLIRKLGLVEPMPEATPA